MSVGCWNCQASVLYDLWSALDDLLRTGRPGAEEQRGDIEFFRDALAPKGFLARDDGYLDRTSGPHCLIALTRIVK